MSETRGRLVGALALVGAGCTTLVGLPDLPEVSKGTGASGATPGGGGVAGHSGSSAGKSMQGGGGMGTGGTSQGGSSNGGDSSGATGGALGGSGNGGSTTNGGTGTDSAGAGDVGTGGAGGSGGTGEIGGTGGSGGTGEMGGTGGSGGTAGSSGCPTGQTTCSNACVDLQTDAANCGTCRHTCTDSCGGGHCFRKVADVVATGAIYLAVDGSYVYFTRTNEGTVSRVARKGGVIEDLASGQKSPRPIAVDASNVYWGNAPSTYGTGSVMKRALAGGNATALATDEPSPAYIAVDANNVYWSNYPPQPPTFTSVPIAGGTKTEFPTGPELGNSVEFSFDGSNLYWAGWYDDGGVWSTPLDGGGPIRTLATVAAYVARAVVFGSNVYVLVGGRGTTSSVSKVSTTGGELTEIVPMTGAYLNVDATGIYVGGAIPPGETGSRIVRVSFDGSSVTTLAVPASALYAFAYGGTEVFWVDSDLTIKAAPTDP
jgi:hypothetical protein